MAKQLQRDDGLFQHHRVLRADGLGVALQPFLCKALAMKHFINVNQLTENF
jgi:hypothetical protein